MPKPRTGNSEMLRVLISPIEMKTLQQLASSRNTTVSELVRQRIRVMVRKHSEQEAAQITATASTEPAQC